MSAMALAYAALSFGSVFGMAACGFAMEDAVKRSGMFARSDAKRWFGIMCLFAVAALISFGLLFWAVSQ